MPFIPLLQSMFRNFPVLMCLSQIKLMNDNIAGKTPIHPVLDKSLPIIPPYLQATYWWAYMDPRGVKIFERQWQVNLILWGNYKRLCDAVFNNHASQFSDGTLQIACAYGNLTARFEKFLGPDKSLDVIDILPIQLNNLARKLSPDSTVKLHCMDSTALLFPDKYFDQALLFFLLHEQPRDIKLKHWLKQFASSIPMANSS